jgi:ribose/xylose/arabinose/galactoside ABC-type transport system permease subunit
MRSEISGSRSRLSRWLADFDLSKWGPFVALIIISILATIASPYFLLPRNLLNVSRQVAQNGIISVGMTFVILTGGIDLSVGSVVALASTMMALTQDLGFFAWIIALAAGALVGFVNGTLITTLRAQPFVITLGTMVAVRGAALTISGGHRIEGVPEMFRWMGVGKVYGVPVQALLFFLVAAIGIFLAHRTTFGRMVYATGANEPAAKLSGIMTSRVKIAVYTISGLLAAFTGTIVASHLNVGDSAFHGLNAELDAIAAVTMGGAALSGGRGMVIGTVAGAFLIGIITNILNLRNVPGDAQLIAKGAIIIFAVAIQQLRRR